MSILIPVRCTSTDDGRRTTDDGRQTTDDGGQMPDGRHQTPDNGRRTTDFCVVCLRQINAMQPRSAFRVPDFGGVRKGRGSLPRMWVRQAMRYTRVCASTASPQAGRNDSPFSNEMRYAFVDEFETHSAIGGQVDNNRERKDATHTAKTRRPPRPGRI